jgi:sRNA-binding carbon storage regulator CsrA
MLVLERKDRESITLTLEDGREILVSVIRLTKHSVRIGIECDRSIMIQRTNNRNGQTVAKKGK